jgi:GH18 family chitinase
MQLSTIFTNRRFRWTESVLAAHTNLTEITTALDLLWRNDVDPSKIILGIGFYGRSFTMEDSSCDIPGCAWSGAGNNGTCTGTAGILSYKGKYIYALENPSFLLTVFRNHGTYGRCEQHSYMG